MLDQAPNPSVVVPHAIVPRACVGDLPRHVGIFACDCDGGKVEHAFRAADDLPAVLVTAAEGSARLLTRSRFMELLTHPFAPELFLGRPLTRLPSTVWRAPLIVADSTPVAAAAALALARARDETYDAVAVQAGDGGLSLLDMRDLLQAQSAVLARYAADLEDTLAELRRTQDDLVQARKMAALGRLVAGVAHEINTPIGMALTAATHLQDRTETLIACLRANALRRSELDGYTATADEACGHLVFNLRRAATLIRDFKQVAVDQTSQERRHFDLRGYIAAVLASLHPQIKRLRHTIALDCPDDIAMDSYPGALAQVLTNLVLNAVTHAFTDDHPGTIRITVQPSDDAVELVLADDGRGIPAEVMPHVFEPFFTTRRGEGGSGLGLHVVYNLVTQALGGSVHCDSRPGVGTRFALRLPLKGPSR